MITNEQIQSQIDLIRSAYLGFSEDLKQIRAGIARHEGYISELIYAQRETTRSLATLRNSIGNETKKDAIEATGETRGTEV